MEIDFEEEMMWKQLASETAKEAAISNILGNIEILMGTVDPLSDEYARLCELQNKINEIIWRGEE